MSDEKLKEAMAEIKMICRKHDIGACITLVSKTHSEYRYEMPKWSVAQLVSGGGVHIRAKREDFPSDETKHAACELTAHLLCQIRDLNALSFLNMEQILKTLEPYWKIEHQGGKDFEPHREH